MITLDIRSTEGQLAYKNCKILVERYEKEYRKALMITDTKKHLIWSIREEASFCYSDYKEGIGFRYKQYERRLKVIKQLLREKYNRI